MWVNTVSADHDVLMCPLPTSFLWKWTDKDLQEPEKDYINPMDLFQKHRNFYSSWADSVFFFLSSYHSPNLHLIALDWLLLLFLKSRTLGQELKFKNWGIVPPERLATLLPTVSINNASPQDLTSAVSVLLLSYHWLSSSSCPPREVKCQKCPHLSFRQERPSALLEHCWLCISNRE